MTNYWWVNHKQNSKEELNGGFIRSPKTKQNGGTNQYYNFMKLTRPGDKILSLTHAEVGHWGTITDYCRTCANPKISRLNPTYIGADGWHVDVQWQPLNAPIRPIEYATELAPLLPTKYSPIRENGYGNQSAYLSQISEALFYKVVQLGKTNIQTIGSLFSQVSQIEEDEEARSIKSIYDDMSLTDTEKKNIIRARRGQGKFRQNVSMVEKYCRITQISQSYLLIASHIKPWRYCETAQERLDGNNGLLLTPTFDKLFDKGLLSFSQTGKVIICDDISDTELTLLGVPKLRSYNVGRFSQAQSEYLKYHRENIYIG